MNLRILYFTTVLILSCLGLSHAGESPFRTREPLPWNLLENGGFERDGTGLFAIGLGQRDRENPATGDASGRFDIPAQKKLMITISSGLRLEKDKDYIVSGRVRSGFKAEGSEATIQASQLNVTGASLKTLTAVRLQGTSAWQMFVLRLRGDGESSLRLTLNASGQPGEAVWLDDLFVGPAHIDLSWNVVPGSGLFQATVADGMQFEFPIPPQTHVMGVFRNGQRVFETKDCDVLHGANVVRFFETPARGEHISVVLRSTLGKAQLPALPVCRYALFSKAGKAEAWLPDAIEDFKAPNVDYAALEREVIELPSIDGLPAEWAADSKHEIALKVHAAGRYALRLRDEKRRLVANLADFVPLPANGTLNAKFTGCDDKGVPLPAGTYIWDVEHRPLNAFPHLDTTSTDAFVSGVWSTPEGWMTSKVRPVNGRPAQVLSLTDDRLKEGDRKAVIPSAQVDSVVQARPGVYFYFNRDTGEVFKLEKDTAAVFPKTAITAKGQSVFLATYETPEGPGLYVARSGGAMAPALLKLDAKGEAVTTFGEGGIVGAPVLQAPAAVVALEDGGVLVADSRGSAWLKRLGADGAVKKEWRGWRGTELNEAAVLESTENAYSSFRRGGAQRAAGPQTKQATKLLIAPSGEIVVAVQEAGSGAYEVQVYSPRGEFLHAIGGGPQQLLAMETPGYPRLWDTSSQTDIVAATNLSFDSRGELAVFDRSTGRLTRWAFLPRVSNLAMTVKSTAKYEPKARVIPSPTGLTELQQRHGLKAKAIDFVDLSEALACRDDGASSVINKPKLGSYRLSGVEPGSWFRAQLRGAQPGKPYLLVVEYPDDVTRATSVSIHYEDDGAQSRLKPSAGYTSGGVYPLSGNLRLYTQLLYPRTATMNVIFKSAMNSEAGGSAVSALVGAAASRVWLFEVEGGLSANPIEEPLAGPKRALLEHRSDSSVLLEQFSGSGDGDGAKQLALAVQRSAEFNAFIGLSGEDVEAPELIARDPKSKEIASAVLSAPDGKGDLYFTYNALRGIPRDRPELADKGLVNELGHADANNLSLVYPEVQQYFRDAMVGFVQQCSASPRFAGITIQLNTHSPPLFGVPGSSSAGYEPASMAAFEKASQKTIAGTSQQEKVAQLNTVLREDFSAWRCSVVRDWIFSVRDAVRKIRPNLQVRLQASGNSDLRFYGFDPAMFNNADGVRVITSLAEGNLLHAMQNKVRTQWNELKTGTSVDVLEFREAGMMPGREHVLAPLVSALIRYNPREISLLSPGRSSAGWELELREFARAFRSLPAGAVEELKDAAGVLKVYRFGEKGAVQYLAVVNGTPAEVKEIVRVPEGLAPSVRDLVSARDLTANPDARGGLGFEALVPAESIRTYRVGK